MQKRILYKNYKCERAIGVWARAAPRRQSADTGAIVMRAFLCGSSMWAQACLGELEARRGRQWKEDATPPKRKRNGGLVKRERGKKKISKKNKK